MSELNESHLISRALDDGLDLRQFANELSDKLSEAENETVTMFQKNASEAVDLHLRVKKCDHILEKVEMMLEGFQGSLGDLSREIRHLQDQSSTMAVKLGNRRSIRQYLSQLVDELVVPEEMVHAICDLEVTDQGFMEQLHQLNRKIRFIREQRFDQ